MIFPGVNPLLNDTVSRRDDKDIFLSPVVHALYDAHTGEGFPSPGAVGKEDAILIIVQQSLFRKQYIVGLFRQQDRDFFSNFSYALGIFGFLLLFFNYSIGFISSSVCSSFNNVCRSSLLISWYSFKASSNAS